MFEEDRSQSKVIDGPTSSGSLAGKLVQRRADKYSQPMVRSADD
jgi:hypothetical protein